MAKKNTEQRKRAVRLRHTEINFAGAPRQYSANEIRTMHLFEMLPPQMPLANVATWLSEKFNLHLRIVGDYILKKAIGGDIDVYGHEVGSGWAKGQVRWYCRNLDKPKLRLDASGAPVGIKFYVEKPSLRNIDFYLTGVNPIQALHVVQESFDNRAALPDGALAIKENHQSIRLQGLDKRQMVAIFAKRIWRSEQEKMQAKRLGEFGNAQEFKTLEQFEDDWLRKFANPPKWLEVCRVEKGKPGKSSSSWNPIKFCKKASRQELLTEEAANEAFKEEELLRPWLAEWETQQS